MGREEDREQRAREENLAICFIVRMPRELRWLIEEHAAWLAKKRKVEQASLASASRDLLRRGLYTTPTWNAYRKRRGPKPRNPAQLELWGVG